MQTNCLAFAVLSKNTKLKTYRLKFTFDIYNKTLAVKNIAYETGDICKIDYVNSAEEITKAIELAKPILRTNNIVLVTERLDS